MFDKNLITSHICINFDDNGKRFYPVISVANAIDYIRQIRINKAKELLGKDTYKINEVPAEQVVFNTALN